MNLENVAIHTIFENFPLQVLDTFGNAKERGKQHGLYFKNQIIENIYKSKETLLKIRKTNEIELQNEIRKFYASLKKYDKDALEEMIGIAEGANALLEDILLINFKPELMNPFCEANLGCTTILNKTQKIFQVGQTFDWFQSCKNINIMIHYHTSSCEGIMICEAGCIGGIGVNNKGIIVLLNYLNNYYIRYDGCGYNCLLRRTLLSDNLYECERELLRSPIAFGLNILLVSWSGQCRDFELTANGIDFCVLDDECIQYIHTNHYLSNKIKTRIVNRDIILESKERYLAAKECLGRFKNRRDGIEQCFKYHNNGEGDVCRHNIDGVETLYSIIIDIQEKSLIFINGLPCEEEKYKICLKSLFN